MQCITTPLKLLPMVERDSHFNLNETLDKTIISRYSFIIYPEYLGIYIHFMSIQKKKKSEIGINLTKDCSNIPYWMFVNDLLFSIGQLRSQLEMLEIF